MANSKNLIEYKKTLALTELQHEVLFGTLLGDATVPSQKGKALCNVKFEQKLDRIDYVNHLYGIFKPWVGTPPKVRQIQGGGARDRSSIWFRTYRHPVFTFYREQFYLNSVKRVPLIIHERMSPRVLAYWFMDDGSNAKSGYKLSTYAFTESDQERLIAALRNLGLAARLHWNETHRYIYIPFESVFRFNELVRPNILSCFSYKLIQK